MTRTFAAFVAAMFSTNAFAAEPNMTPADSTEDSWIDSIKTEEQFCSAEAECKQYTDLVTRVSHLEEQKKLFGKAKTPRLDAVEQAIEDIKRQLEDIRQQLKNVPPPQPPTPVSDVDLVQLEKDVKQLKIDVQSLKDRVAALEEHDKAQDKRLTDLEAASAPQIRGGLGFAGGYMHQVGFNRPDAMTSSDLGVFRPELDFRVDYVDGFVIQLGGFGTFGTDATVGGGGQFYAGHFLGDKSVWALGGIAGFQYHAVYGRGLHNTSPLADYSGIDLGLRAEVEPISGFDLHADLFLDFGRANDGYQDDLRLIVPEPGIMLGVTFYFPGHKPAKEEVKKPDASPEPAPQNSEQAPAAVPAPNASSGDISPEARHAIAEGIAESEQEKILVIVPARH